MPYKELRSNEAVTTSEQMKERVLKAREVQSARGFNNSVAPPGELRKLAALDDAGERTLEMAIRKLGLSARAHDRILRVSKNDCGFERSGECSGQARGGGGAVPEFRPQLLELVVYY